MSLIKSYLLIIIFFPVTFIFAQEKKDKWDVNNPPGELKSVAFDLTEGTWMNLDLSPDGQIIVFDLLGDIYTMPVNGGEAKILRSGMAYEVQPRFSPDGKTILFTSDAGGADNIWTIKLDGSDAKQVTKEDFHLLNNPTWLPNGDYFIARKHFTSTRSAGAGEMWMYHISGGAGVQITKRKNDQQDVNEPCVSNDGKYLYYSEDVYPGGKFNYNKNPNKQIYVIKQYNFETGKTKTVISGPGSASRPQINHQGNRIAFIKRMRDKTVLFIKDLETSEEFNK